MTDKLQEALRIANNALWYADSADYATALWEICTVITGDKEFRPDEFMKEQS
jgi:hypothetical protein